MRNGVSAVLITRNEAPLIRRCLESLGGLDKVVVYDTGSSDLTPDIARSMGADVHVGVPEIPFHFGNARNAALAMARHDWVLSIDADEVLREGSIGEIRNAVKRYPTAVGYRIQFIHRDGEGTTEMPSPRMVLFKRAAWTWKYRVHESLQPVEQFQGPRSVKDVPSIIIDHFPPADKSARREQNMELLRLCIKETPEYHYAFHQLAMEHILREEWEEAIPHLEYFIGSPAAKRPPYGPTCALMQLAKCFARTGDLEKAMPAFADAAKALPNRREALYWGALETIRANRPWEAVWWLEETLKREPNIDPSFPLYSKEANEGHLVTETLAECKQILKDAEEKYKAQQAASS